MKFLPLIGKQLKDDSMIEILEDLDMTVEYEFDRSHENMPDKYWASSKENGLQLGFDESQVLQTIFIYLLPIEEFTPFREEITDIMFFDTKGSVESWAKENKLSHKIGEPKEFMKIWRDWIRIERDGKFIHYEFRDEGAAMVTIFKAS